MESPIIYARRFQGLALEYLNHCDAAATEQDSQNFVMLLLEYARITSYVYSAVVTQLVSSSTFSNDDGGDKIYLISKSALKAMMSKTTTAEEAQGTTEDTGNDHSPLANTTCLTEIQAIKNMIRSAICAEKRHAKEDRSSFRVTLDDSVRGLLGLHRRNKVLGVDLRNYPK